MGSSLRSGIDCEGGERQLRTHGSPRLDADADAAAGGRQRAARRLAHDQLEAVVAGEPELERGAEIDRLDHLAGEGIARRRREALGPHQHADARADAARRCAISSARPPSSVTVPASRHRAVEDVALAHEVGDEIVGRPLVDLGRRGDLLDRALVHHRDAVGQDQRLFLVVGDEDRGEAEPALQAAHLELHGLAQLAVERAERLVEQQQARVEDDGAGERHALLLAAGELARQALLVARRARPAPAPRRPGARSRAVATLRISSGKATLRSHREMREQRVVLEHHADVAPGRRQAR